MTTTRDKQEEVTLTVYFSGTSHVIQNPLYLAALLYESTEATPTHLKMGFSGCGKTNGLNGVIFGAGLEEQCREVQKKVTELLKANKKVKLNCYGHSRGAIAALMLAQLLGGHDEDVLEVNLALLDTVPGNFITTVKLDLFSRTLSKQNFDLSRCKNLKNVFSLYTNEPLSNVAAHAPLLPKYPQHTRVIQDIQPGCHAGVQFQQVTHKTIAFTPLYGRLPDQKCFITFNRIVEFLTACGTKLRFQSKSLVVNQKTFTPGDTSQINDEIKSIYAKEKEALKAPTTRACHSLRGEKIETIPGKPYLNLHDKQLSEDKKKHDNKQKDDIALIISPSEEVFCAGPVYDYESKAMRNLFNEFITQAQEGMSKTSKNSEKGKIFSAWLLEMKQIETFSSKEQLKHAMRNVLAIALQRDRNRLSWFSTTTSGFSILALLQEPKYQVFSQLIQGTSSHPVRYRDLRTFVIGNNDSSYFYMKNRENTYQIVKSPGDKALLTTNLATHYLTRPLK